MREHQHIEFSDDGGIVTPAGEVFFSRLGIDLSAARTSRRVFCRPCLDFSERRPHIAGTVGTALANRLFELNWIARKRGVRALTITPVGWGKIEQAFGCSLHDHTVHARPALRIARVTRTIPKSGSRLSEKIIDAKTTTALWCVPHKGGTMITEIAQIDVKPGMEAEFEAGVAKAAPAFKRAKGCHGLVLEKSIEKPSRYRLFVQWETIENHTVDFRGSPDFRVARLRRPLLQSPPTVEHVTQVLKAF